MRKLNTLQNDNYSCLVDESFPGASQYLCDAIGVGLTVTNPAQTVCVENPVSRPYLVVILI